MPQNWPEKEGDVSLRRRAGMCPSLILSLCICYHELTYKLHISPVHVGHGNEGFE